MDFSLITDDELLARIRAFITQHGLKPTTFGRMTLGDGNLITNLEGGRSLSLKSAKKVMAFMSSYTPSDSSDEPPANSPKVDDTSNRINPKPTRTAYSQSNRAGQEA